MNIPGRTFIADEKFFTDWMPRGGDDAIFRAQLTGTEGADLTSHIFIWTKNRDEQGGGERLNDGASTPNDYDFGFVDSDLAGKTSQVLVQSVNKVERGLKELVRFEIELSSGDPGSFQAIRIFPPVWMDRGITT